MIAQNILNDFIGVFCELFLIELYDAFLNNIFSFFGQLFSKVFSQSFSNKIAWLLRKLCRIVDDIWWFFVLFLDEDLCGYLHYLKLSTVYFWSDIFVLFNWIDNRFGNLFFNHDLDRYLDGCYFLDGNFDLNYHFHWNFNWQNYFFYHFYLLLHDNFNWNLYWQYCLLLPLFFFFVGTFLFRARRMVNWFFCWFQRFFLERYLAWNKVIHTFLFHWYLNRYLDRKNINSFLLHNYLNWDFNWHHLNILIAARFLNINDLLSIPEDFLLNINFNWNLNGYRHKHLLLNFHRNFKNNLVWFINSRR